MSVLVVLEQRGGKWNRMSFEALAAARKIAESLSSPVTAAILGSDIDALSAEAARYGAAKLVSVSHPLLANYTPEAYTSALEQLTKALSPKVVVFPHTYQVRDFAPKLATRFGKSLVSDVIDIKAENGSVIYVRQLFQGKLNADVRSNGDPQFVSVQAGAF